MAGMVKTRSRCRPVTRYFAAALVVISTACPGQGRAQTAIAPIPYFRIASGGLADALDRFSEQSGLQVIYGTDLPRGLVVPETIGPMPPAEALDRLLRGSGLSWKRVDGHTIAILSPAPPTPAPVMGAAKPQAASPTAVEIRDGVAMLTPISVYTDPRRLLPGEVSESSFGFAKSLEETPRSVSFISQENIDLFGLSAVEDLVRVVPGTYTPTRFGIQGGIDVRSVPADTFFRGMKRLNLQGHAPTVLSAMDSIEVVRGPPSPIYGMGRIGGYTNIVPRSGRAANGSYLEQAEGRVKAVAGSYDRGEFSAEVQGPLSFDGRSGGYHAFGMVLDSESYAHGVPLDAKLVQGAISLDHVLGSFRLETGLSAQTSRSAGALLGRFTQDVVDRGRYIRGIPLVNLDLNGNGTIGYREYHAASPARGDLTDFNQPLVQRWDWPLDQQGRPLPIDQFPKIPGIPESLFYYFQEHPEADPTGLLRAQGIGGPRPGPGGSGYVPIGFALDPRTVGFDKLDRRRFAAYERELRADLVTLFVDLIDDRDPNFTIKNQLFFDGMNQYKISEQPFGTDQQPRVVEDKLTITRRVQELPPWLRINSLASANVRYTESPTRQCFGDFSTNRTDVMASTWVSDRGGMTPNTTFTNCLVNDDVDDDGFPFTNDGKTRYSEVGAGLLLDIDLFDKTNLLIGARRDGSEARNVERAGTRRLGTGTSDNPGAPVTSATRVRGWDDGSSWTLSVSQHLPFNIRPYLTVAEASITLDNNANRLLAPVIETGHIGQSRLRELGVKAGLLDKTLFFSSALYEQRRINVDAPDDPAITAEASSTITRGWETELKWVPTRDFFASFYALSQKTTYNPNRGGSILIDARSLGFQDVLDPETGAVIYPAEAFLYGGRAFLMLPPGVDAFRERQGNPNTQLGFSVHTQLAGELGITFGGNYFSSVHAGRLQRIELPDAYVFNAGLQWGHRPWQLRLDAFNLFEERYFRARNGDTLADITASALPERRWQFTVSRDF